MKRTAKVCLPTRAIQLVRTVLLGALVAATACAAAQDTDAVHLLQARMWIEPGAGYDAPAHPPMSAAPLDAPAGTPAGAPAGASDPTQASVALPHSRPRAVTPPHDAVSAAPEVAWYRLEVPAALLASPAALRGLYLYLPRWQTIGTMAVYADDRLVWHSAGSRVWNSFNRPLWLPLSAAAGEPAAKVLLLRMASQQGIGGAVSTAWVGTEDALHWRWRARTWLQNDLIGQTSTAFVIIGLFAFAVWWVRRRELMYALFFACAVTHAMQTAQYLMNDHSPALPDDWFGWMTANAVGWSMVCVFSFAYQVHRRRMPWLALAVIAMVLVQSLVTLPVAALLPHLSTILPLIYAPTGIITLAIAASGLWASYVSRSREGMVLFAWFSLRMPAGLHDLALQNYRIDVEYLYLTPYTSIGLLAIFLSIGHRRYTGAMREVEIVNTGLEQRLSEREQALTRSHQQLRELERQQTLTAERQRMMQDMHDGIGSSLMSALRMVERGMASSDATAQTLRDCIDDLKLAIDSLDPADADLLGLLAAVRFRLAPRLTAAGITLTWSVQDLPPLHWLDAQSALHVLRIVQEVLTNILKHSRATAIDVATAQEGTEVVVRIRDNGDAFVVAADMPFGVRAGKGLSNVRSRAKGLGASCQWAAWEGGGEFSLRLPIERGAVGKI